MRFRINKKKYGQRWQAETVFSMIKRRLGEATGARTYHSQCRALLLKVVTHNILGNSKEIQRGQAFISEEKESRGR